MYKTEFLNGVSVQNMSCLLTLLEEIVYWPPYSEMWLLSTSGPYEKVILTLVSQQLF